MSLKRRELAFGGPFEEKAKGFEEKWGPISFRFDIPKLILIFWMAKH